MSGPVWMSSVYGNYQIGDKLGVRAKHFSEEWMPAQYIQLPWPKNISDAASKNSKGYVSARLDMPEKAAVWDNGCFERATDVFTVSGYFVITGELIGIFSQMDLGDGGLVPLPFYEADLVTPLTQQFFILNVGARKDTFLPEASENAREFMLDLETGKQLWNVNRSKPDGVVALATTALDGPDLWVEEAVSRKLFVSDRLGSALSKTRHAKEWELLPCKVMNAASERKRYLGYEVQHVFMEEINEPRTPAARNAQLLLAEIGFDIQSRGNKIALFAGALS
jgi:hypothetical protein